MFLASYLGNEAADVAQRVAWRKIVWGTLHRHSMLVACCLLLLCVPLSAQSQSSRDIGEPVFEIDIPAGNAADALNRLAEQTGAILLFPYDLAEARQTNAVAGRYTLMQALGALLKDSGLSGGLSDRRVIQISVDGKPTTTNETSKSGEQGMQASKKAGLIAIVAGALTGGVNAQEGQRDTETSVVTGQVTDARTGTNLKGAKVTVEETGQWTRTDNLGEYRLTNVPSGNAILTVSYLGYVGQSTSVSIRPPAVSRDFALRGGTEIEEIVVFGQQSARAQALNLERTAVNTTTVVSADQLGTFNGTTISEALRRAPGVAFIPDEATGDGANIIVRGIEPDLNQVQLNGLRLLDGSGLGRSPDLSGILLEGIESVTINKSLLPSQDSNGAGALIEIETKSPLDRDLRFAIFSLEYGERREDFWDDFLVGGTVSGIFGSDETFGASLSASYRETSTTRVSYSVGAGGGARIGPYLPLNADGEPVSRTDDIDPRASFPFASGIDELYPAGVSTVQGSTDVEILSVNGTLETKLADHTSVRFDATYSERKNDSFTLQTAFSGQSEYELLPVESLGGEERFAIVAEDANPGVINGLVARSGALSPNAETNTLGLSLRGDTNIDAWSVGYQAGYTQSENNSGERFDVSLGSLSLDGPTLFSGPVADRSILSDTALANTTSDGRIVSLFAPLTPDDDSFVLPLFNQAGFEFYNTIDSQFLNQVQRLGPRESESDALTLDISVRRSFGSRVLKYVETGVVYQDTEFFSPGPGQGATTGQSIFELTDGSSISDIGLVFGPGILRRIGAPADLSALTRSGVEAAYAGLDTAVAGGLLTETSLQGATDLLFSTTNEETLSAYFEAQLQFGKLEVVGGARVERLDLSSEYFQLPLAIIGFFEIPDLSEFAGFVEASAERTDVLPRMAATYRQSDNLLFRAAYYKTVAQPQLAFLTSVDRVEYNALFLLPRPELSVTRGNPELAPAETDNFSADVELYTDSGVFSLGLFYKETKNFLQNNIIRGDRGVLPEDFELPGAFVPGTGPVQIADNAVFTFTRPENSEGVAETWGIELAVEQRLSMLPEPWDGMSLFANYTHTQSERPFRFPVSDTIDPSGFIELELSNQDAPENQGTVGLLYSRYGIDGSLLYTYQDRRISGFNEFGLSEFNEEFDSLDLQLSYLWRFGSTNIRFLFRGNDLLRGSDDPFLQTSRGGDDGVPKYFTGSTYLGGRSFEAGISVLFD